MEGNNPRRDVTKSVVGEIQRLRSEIRNPISTEEKPIRFGDKTPKEMKLEKIKQKFNLTHGKGKRKKKKK